MDKIIITDKNTDMAITNACQKLNTTAGKLNYKVLEHNRKFTTIEAWIEGTKNLEQSKLRKCPDCDKEISRKAESCPHCGCPIEKTIACARCGYDTDLTYKQIQEKGCIVNCDNSGYEVRVTTPEEEIRREIQRQNEVKTVECPYCHSTNTTKISTTAKVTNIAMFGLLGNKRKKTFHCNNCEYEW